MIKNIVKVLFLPVMIPLLVILFSNVNVEASTKINDKYVTVDGYDYYLYLSDESTINSNDLKYYSVAQYSNSNGIITRVYWTSNPIITYTDKDSKKGKNYGTVVMNSFLNQGSLTVYENNVDIFLKSSDDYRTVKANYNIYNEDGTVFFQITPNSTTSSPQVTQALPQHPSQGKIQEVVQGVEMTGVTKTVVSLIPLLMVLVISVLALRKAWSLLKRA